MALKGISQREFARRDGCSKTLVRRGLSQGNLVAFEDGSIDPALVGSAWRRGNRLAQLDADVPGDADISFAEAQRRKEAALARLRELEFEQKSGRLCDVAIVHSEVFAIARAERDALMNWPSRVAPLLAAEFGIDQVRLAVSLERHIRQFLTERSDPQLRLDKPRG
jgi:hypothetical protein